MFNCAICQTELPSQILFYLWEEIAGNYVVDDLGQMDHILPAGAGMWDWVPWDYAVHTLWDTLVNEDSDSVAIDIKFKTPRGVSLSAVRYRRYRGAWGSYSG